MSTRVFFLFSRLLFCISFVMMSRWHLRLEMGELCSWRAEG